MSQSLRLVAFAREEGTPYGIQATEQLAAAVLGCHWDALEALARVLRQPPHRLSYRQVWRVVRPWLWDLDEGTG